MDETRSRFAEIAALPDEQIELDEAALLIAAETEDNINVTLYLQALDELAFKFERSFDAASGLGVSVNSLINFIHDIEGFSGNVKNY